MSKIKPNAPKILVIRHAEKPPDSPPPHGVTIKGEQDKESLTVQGWLRAGALVSFFVPTNRQFQNSDIATPRFIYAAGVASSSQSKRPQETVIPLSERLELEINTNYSKGQEAALVADALTCNGVVLLCWQHQEIPCIANHLLGNHTTAPQHWPENRFDVVWVFDWDFTSESYSFKQVPQGLLAGDSSTLID